VIARLETAARLSPEFQAIFAAAERAELSNSCCVADWMEVCSELQEQLVLRALHAKDGPEGAQGVVEGVFAPSADELARAVQHAIGSEHYPALEGTPLAFFSPPDSVLLRGMNELRTAGADFPDTVGKVQLYSRFNRARQGELVPGNFAPEAPLHWLDGDTSSLHALVRAAHPLPLIVIAGSYS
jgi:hypothetical protein